jgi:hypothetical protein
MTFIKLLFLIAAIHYRSLHCNRLYMLQRHKLSAFCVPIVLLFTNSRCRILGGVAVCHIRLFKTWKQMFLTKPEVKYFKTGLPKLRHLQHWVRKSTAIWNCNVGTYELIVTETSELRRGKMENRKQEGFFFISNFRHVWNAICFLLC